MSGATSSLPMRSSDPRRVLLVRCPSIRLGEKQRPALVYLAGALVSTIQRFTGLREVSPTRPRLSLTLGPALFPFSPTCSPFPLLLRSYFIIRQFALGWWAFLDATIMSAHAKPISDPDSPYDPIPVRVTFADWAPGLCATLGMIIVNLIDKQRLLADDGGGGGGGWGGDGWGGGGVAWRARLFLFVGFALMAGGLAGSIVRLFSLLAPAPPVEEAR